MTLEGISVQQSFRAGSRKLIDNYAKVQTELDTQTEYSCEVYSWHNGAWVNECGVKGSQTLFIILGFSVLFLMLILCLFLLICFYNRHARQESRRSSSVIPDLADSSTPNTAEESDGEEKEGTGKAFIVVLNPGEERPTFVASKSPLHARGTPQFFTPQEFYVDNKTTSDTAPQMPREVVATTTSTSRQSHNIIHRTAIEDESLRSAQLDVLDPRGHSNCRENT